MDRRIIWGVIIVAVLIIGAVAGVFLFYKPPSMNMKIGYLPAASYGLIWVAYEGGFFEHEGLNVTLIEYGSVADLVAALSRGDIDGAPVTSVAIAGFIRNLDAVVVAGNSLDGTALVSTKGSSIGSLSDLSGKRVATVLYVPGDFIFKKLLGELGIAVNFSSYMSPADALLALEGGQVDAAFLWEPYSSLAAYRNLEIVLWDKEVYPVDYPCCLQVFRSSFASSDPDAVTKFVKALIKAEVFAYNKPDESLPMVKKYLPALSYPIIYDSIIGLEPRINQSRNPLSGYFNVTELQQFFQLLIPSILSLNDYNQLVTKLDTRYYNAALSELKREGFNLPSIYTKKVG
ncbi:MAG: ABC transporter substrate-binding protein [Candidatus Verstraetearchaeota archaeon]|nr:ABC transporter substrate-binding protein [Candidatus Verstraetearchaeota archaeon]